MNRIKIEIYFLQILSFIVFILFLKVPMYKTEYYGLDANYTFETIMWILFGCLLVFNHVVLKYKIWSNILISPFIAFVAALISGSIFYSAIAKLVEMDHEVTPLGWHFKYKWLVLLLTGIWLIILTEIVFLINNTLVTRIKNWINEK